MRTVISLPATTAQKNVPNTLSVSLRFVQGIIARLTLQNDATELQLKRFS